jgi:hypothetical protein
MLAMSALAYVQRRADHVSPLRATCDTSSLRLLLAPTKQHSAPLPPRIDAADSEMEPGLLHVLLYDLFLGVEATASRPQCCLRDDARACAPERGLGKEK